VSVLGKQFAAAKAAGIVVSLSSITDLPKDFPGYASLTNGPSTDAIDGDINAAMVLRDSGCTANVAVFNLAGYPILKVQTNAFASFMAAQCPSCKVNYSEIQASDLGTPAATTRIVATLQANPSINYVYCVLGNICDGLHAALEQANITDVKVFGWQPDAQAIAGLQTGEDSWWVGNGDGINGLAVLDGALRALDTRKAAVQPTQPIAIFTPGNSKGLKAFGQGAPAYPVDYQHLFEVLWHASS
jgi:ABC-type sugar transport system substrate-binding protein